MKRPQSIFYTAAPLISGLLTLSILCTASATTLLVKPDGTRQPFDGEPEEGADLGVRLAKLFVADGARDYIAGYK